MADVQEEEKRKRYISVFQPLRRMCRPGQLLAIAAEMGVRDVKEGGRAEGFEVESVLALRRRLSRSLTRCDNQKGRR